MLSQTQIRNLKIILLFLIIIGIIGAVLYIIYGLALIWQAFAAAIITGILTIIIVLLIILLIYLWTRNLLLRRDLKNCEAELQRSKEELKKYKNNKP